MGVRSASALVVPAVLGALLVVPAAADGTGAGLRALPRPDGLLLQVGPQGPVSHRSPGDVLTAARRYGDAAAILRTLSDAAVAAGQPAPLVVAAADGDDGEEVVGATFAAAVPAGDLDGDGLTDTLTYTDDGTGLALVVHRGTDGTLLWIRPLDAVTGTFAFPLGRDLTGDGVDDLFLDELSFTGTEQEQKSAIGYRYAFSGSVRHGYGVVSGADGSTTWSAQVTGRLEETFEHSGDPLGFAGDGRYRLRSTNLAVLARVSEDGDGDRLPDVLVNEIDLDLDARGTGGGAFVTDGAYAFAGRGTLSVSSATRAARRAGDDGAVTVVRAAAGQSGISLLVPVDQVVGSAVPDLAWTTGALPSVDRTCAHTPVPTPCLDRSTGAERVSVELLDGSTGRTAWAMAAPGYGAFVEPAHADLDGDGGADVVVSLLDEQGGRLIALSGNGGSALWDARSEVFPPSFVEAVAGAAGTLAVVADAVFGDDGGITLVTERRDGRTGAVVGSDRYVAAVPQLQDGAGGSGSFVLVGLETTGDGDGDGGRELGVYSLALAVSFDEEFEVVDEATRSGAEYRDLSTGDLRLAEAADDLRLLLPSGDLDGDGLVDLQRQVFGLEPTEPGSTTGVRLADGRSLWRLEGEFPTVAGDQDGVRGEELLVVRPAGDVLQTVSLGGTDVGVRWAADAAPRR